MTTSIDTIALDPSASLKAPDVSRLTTQSLSGTGVFDVLMNATKLHLKEEYDSERITGSEYTTLYLGAMTSVMQQSVQFLLNTQQEEQIQAEIALTRQKTVTELAQTDDTLPLGLGFNGDSEVEGLVASKKAIDLLQATLVDSQVRASDSNIVIQEDLAALKRTTTVAELELHTLLNEAQIDASNANIEVQADLATAKITNDHISTTAQRELADSKIANDLVSTTAQRDLADSKIANDLLNTEIQRELADAKIANEIITTTAQKELADSKIANDLVSTTAERELASSKIANDLINTTANRELTDAKISATNAEILNQGQITAAQVDNFEATSTLSKQKVVTELAQTCNSIASAKTAGYGLNDTAFVEGLVKTQVDLAAANVLLTTQKTVTEVGQTSDTKPISLGAVASTDIEGLIKSQKGKTDAEIELLTQKVATELAQTSDNIPAGLAKNTSTTVGGRTAIENTLLAAQTDGYARDAEQKLAKMVLDVYSILLTQDIVTGENVPNLAESSINAIVAKAKAGIKVAG